MALALELLLTGVFAGLMVEYASRGLLAYTTSYQLKMVETGKVYL